MASPRYHTKPEVAARGRYSVDTVNRDIKAGFLEAVRLSSRRVLIASPAVERWLAARPVAAKAKVRPAAPDPEAA